MPTGRFILVVGPSGAGKDTLISAAAERLRTDPRFVFARRCVTRSAKADIEDHDTISRDTFEQLVAAGEVALAWEAHGLGYIIPATTRAEVAAGRFVVCNTSRQVIADAQRKLPGCAVILVTADTGVRAQRLAARGRETAEENARRLAREVVSLPPSLAAATIDNSGDLAASIEAFCAALLTIADAPPQTGTAQ